MSARVGRHTLLTALILVLVGRGVASGHGAAVPFPFWGDTFTSEDAHCQRVIGAAGTRCANRMWATRTTCLRSAMRGEPCDTQSTEAAFQMARVQAFNLIDPHCTDRMAGTLGFLGVFEVQGDLETFWRGLDEALTSAVYGPIMQDDQPGPVDTPTQRCVEAAGAASTKMIRFAFDARRSALDRIAKKHLPPSAKQALLDRSTQRIGRARQALADRVAARCTESAFTAIYQRSIDTFLDGIAQRAGCLGGAVYVQNALVCPVPVCGNGIKEPGETCADGKY